ncbi:MAG: phage head closure protein [Eubacteriales bacterium]
MARQDRELYFISVTITEDEIGNQIETPVERMVFAEELAVFSSEFYNAAVAGLRPEKMFEVYTREYQGEAKLKHNNITYRIIRTGLGKAKEKTRLTCERVTADG